MRIEKLIVSNFKKFEEKTFEFHPQFTLLVGENGTGKTAILDALNIGAGAYLLGIPEMQAPSIKRKFIRRETRQNGEFATFEPIVPCAVSCTGQVHGSNLSWTRTLSSSRGRTDRAGATKLRVRVEEIYQANGQETNFPLIACYGTNRLWIEPRTGSSVSSVVRQPIGKQSRFEAYRGCLNTAISSEFVRRWVKKMELIKLRKERRLKSIDAVYSAVIGCVEGVREVWYDFEHDDISLEFGSGEMSLFEILSDGQRSMTALAADLAMRCVQLNPHLSSEAPHETEGVVLIDELDLHLHPNWQRGVVRNLVSLFPKLQFVATTHSPFIVQSLDGQGLINLNDVGTLEERREIFSIEDVAEETMGVESPQRSKWFLKMEAAALHYYKLLEHLDSDDPKVEEAKAELDRIENRFSDYPAYSALLKLHRSAAQ